MSQRASGHARAKHDLYETPPWVIDKGLAHHLPVAGLKVIEPCCGSGKVVAVLTRLGAEVWASDKNTIASTIRRAAELGSTPFRKLDFLRAPLAAFLDADALVINPPYGVQGKDAEAFIRRVLEILRAEGFRGRRVWCAILLPADFDSASTRAQLFEMCQNFRARIVLRQRIEWFKRQKGKSGPSANHTWFIFDSIARNAGELPVNVYAPPVVGSSAISPPLHWHRAQWR